MIFVCQILLLSIFSHGQPPSYSLSDNISLNGPDSLKKDLNTLYNWFPGEYDNHRQVYREAVNNVPQERKHRHTHHIFHPVSLSFIPGKLLYAQQYQHYDPDDIYRQRIYSLEVDETEAAIRLTIYTPKNPEQLIDAHLDKTKFDGLTAEDFYLKPGCEVYWEKNGNQFEGYLKENACNYYSDRFQSHVFLNETLILRKDALLLDDSAKDENGKLIFGVHDKGPTINLKVTPCQTNN